MKNVLLKFAGLFVEKVPVDEHGNPRSDTLPRPAVTPVAMPGSGPGGQPLQGQFQAPHAARPGGVAGQAPGMAQPPQQQQQGAPGVAVPVPGVPGAALPGGAPPQAGSPVAIALRAWVPQEYAAHLAPYGLHVIAAGGSVTSEQARGWGADVLVVSAECLGQDLHLLQQPQLPTVFITPQPVMLPDVSGVVQVQEPLRASEVAQAARDAAAEFAASHPR